MHKDRITHGNPFVKKLIISIKNPVIINVIPPKCWLFFHVVEFFILQTVRSPNAEFNLTLGIILPMIIIIMPKMAKMSWLISIEMLERFSTA